MKRGIVLCALALALAPAPAAALVPGSAWLALGVSSGTTWFDAHLADYQWNLAPRPSWGAVAQAGVGRAALAVRVGSSLSSQALGAVATPSSAGVHLTTVDLAADLTLVRVLGVAVLGRVAAGRVGIGYAPGQVTVDTGAGSTTVALAPVLAWTWSGGLGVRRALPGGFAATLAAERSSFALETAHRAGADVVRGREGFGNWNGRLELTRVFAL